MKQRFQIFIRFLRWYWSAKTRFQIHSPSVFTFIQNVIEDNRNFYAYKIIENLRKKLLKNKQVLAIYDLGAGSVVSKKRHRTIRSIARSTLSSPEQCRQLFRMVQLYKPKTILELGTSLGISTLYFSMAARHSRVLTLEGDATIARVAQVNFDALGARNIELHTGPFATNLIPALEKLERLDFVFLDGNHRKAPTVQYFERCLEYAHTNTILVIDDIHWSRGMEEAWNVICTHQRVSLSLDLFYYGVIFLSDSRKQKEHFSLISSQWKPWTGLTQ